MKNYEVVRVLGGGAFGEVYRGTTGDTVALKKLTLNTNINRTIRSAKRDLRPLLDKSHAHIAKYRDCYEKDESLWLVLEYCSQGNLNDFLLYQSPGKDVILRLMKEIASAVSFLHDNNIVHRDLKPDNILLTGNSWDPVVKVSDYGLASVCGVGHDSLLKHYKAESPRGTLYFLAPEVIKAREKGESYEKYCDVFSMGVIFVAMFDGKPSEGKVVAYVQPSLSNLLALNFKPMSFGRYLCANRKSDLSDKILNKNVNERTEQFKQLILSMLQRAGHRRPVASYVLEQLQKINSNALPERRFRIPLSGETILWPIFVFCCFVLLCFIRYTENEGFISRLSEYLIVCLVCCVAIILWP